MLAGVGPATAGERAPLAGGGEVGGLVAAVGRRGIGGPATGVGVVWARTVRGGIVGQGYDEVRLRFEARQAADLGMKLG